VGDDWNVNIPTLCGICGWRLLPDQEKCSGCLRYLTTDEQKAMQSALRKSTKLIAKGERT
jgi:hypothetical protein